MFRDDNATVEVTDPDEYREAVEAADVLGLELSRVDGDGYGWEAKDGQPVQPGSSGEIDIVRVTDGWFHMKLVGPDGTEVVPVKCGRSSSESLRDAKLILRFN